VPFLERRGLPKARTCLCVALHHRDRLLLLAPRDAERKTSRSEQDQAYNRRIHSRQTDSQGAWSSLIS